MPIYVGASFLKCLDQYVLMKKLPEITTERRAVAVFKDMMREGLTIRNVMIKAFISNDDIIRSYADGEASEKADQAKWQEEERKRRKAETDDGTGQAKGREVVKGRASSPARRRTR